MSDRIVNSTWWLTLMFMIAATGCTALFVGYRGMFELFAARWEAGASLVGISVACATATLMMCRYRNDLLL